LLGLLGRVVLGTLKKHQGASGLDASGLANLLTSQKDHIAEAMPSGIANVLGGTGVLHSIGERANEAARSTGSAVRRVTHQPPSLNWLAWAIPIIALLVAGYFLIPQTSPTVETPATATTQPAAETVGLMVDGVDIGASVSSTIGTVKTTLESITDSATAQTALPKLEEATGALDKMSGVVGKLSPEQKTAFIGHITAARPALDPLFDKVLAIPGVSDIAKPTIDGLRVKLEALSKA